MSFDCNNGKKVPDDYSEKLSNVAEKEAKKLVELKPVSIMFQRDTRKRVGKHFRES